MSKCRKGFVQKTYYSVRSALFFVPLRQATVQAKPPLLGHAGAYEKHNAVPILDQRREACVALR